MASLGLSMLRPMWGRMVLQTSKYCWNQMAASGMMQRRIAEGNLGLRLFWMESSVAVEEREGV